MNHKEFITREDIERCIRHGEQHNFILKVLSLRTKYSIDAEELFWRVDGDKVSFYIMACDGDLVDLTPNTYPELIKAITDVLSAGLFSHYGTALFCARKTGYVSKRMDYPEKLLELMRG